LDWGQKWLPATTTRRFNILGSNRDSPRRNILKLAVNLRMWQLNILNLTAQRPAKLDILTPRCMLTAAQGMSNTITKIVPGELIVLLSKERMLAVLGGMIKSELVRRAPVSERDFIKQFFEKSWCL
jgi:hypothetical protein